MATMESLAAGVREKALLYLQESGEDATTFPSSIVDFVIEYAVKNSHFPNHYTDDDVATILSKLQTVMALSCQEIYNRAGSEGETAHTEGQIVRVYDSSWISDSLIRALPNFANTPSTLRL